MRLYLVQHGEAKSKDEAPERHLTEKGLRDVEKTAAFVKPLGLSVSAVWHSGKARALETAEILGGAVTAPGGVIRHDGLAPNDPVTPIRKEIEETEEIKEAGGDLMIVGHMPFMGKLASLLVAGTETAGAVAFRQGGVVCLGRTAHSNGALLETASAANLPGRTVGGRPRKRGEEGSWSVLWAVTPEILR